MHRRIADDPLRLALERGYRVVGLDLSEPMLAHARANAGPYPDTGQARFVQADAADFELDERFGLVIATYDALNHLPSLDALRRCFRCVYATLEPGGSFLFDLNTRAGLEQWSNISVDDRDEVMIVTRGVFHAQMERAWLQLSGFVRRPDGLYERFEEVVYNTVFDLTAVRAALVATGWPQVHLARWTDLTVPLDAPESEARVFFVASGKP